MHLLVIGLILFLAVHSISIVGENWRDQKVEKLGEWTWKGLYSVAAILGFVLLVKGYALARQDPILLYASPVWLRHLSILLLLPVFPLILSVYLPGRIQAAVGHPTLVAAQILVLRSSARKWDARRPDVIRIAAGLGGHRSSIHVAAYCPHDSGGASLRSK
jgi:uncharacterized membrane protein